MKFVIFILLLLTSTLSVHAQSAAYFNSRALDLWNGDKHEESLEMCQQAVFMEPSNLIFRLDYGRRLAALGRYSEAQREFLQCLGRDSTYIQVYNLSGYNYFRVGAYRKALHRYEKGLSFADKTGGLTHLSMYRGIGNCYAALLKT